MLQSYLHDRQRNETLALAQDTGNADPQTLKDKKKWLDGLHTSISGGKDDNAAGKVDDARQS